MTANFTVFTKRKSCIVAVLFYGSCIAKGRVIWPNNKKGFHCETPDIANIQIALVNVCV